KRLSALDRGIALNRNQRYSQRQLNLDFLLVPVGCFGQGAQKLKGLSKTGDRFDIGGMRERPAPGLEPATDGEEVITGLLMVIGQNLRPGFGDLRLIAF